MRITLLLISLLLNSFLAHASGSLVVMQYHNVSDSTPRSTSITLEELKQHITWLRNNHFQIKPLDVALNEVKQGKYSDKDFIVSLSFDDSHVSVCTTAWPYLRDEKIPFTIFINSGPIQKKYGSQCNIEQLKAMADSGLVIIGNHGKDHIHMATQSNYASEAEWLAAVSNEIDQTQQFIANHFGKQALLFAYPYGEYNQTVQNLLQQRGYIAFGQQSGAIGEHSDFLGLPRFPLSGNYANLTTLKDKLRSMAFPAKITPSTDNPISAQSTHNPPILTLQLQQALTSKTNCFLANGTPISITTEQDKITVQSETALNKGRQRYNCTARDNKTGRYYWLSHQWLIE